MNSVMSVLTSSMSLYYSILLWYGLYGQSFQSPKEDIIAQTILTISIIRLPYVRVYHERYMLNNDKKIYTYSTLSEPIKRPLLKSIVIDTNIFYMPLLIISFPGLRRMSPPLLEQYSSLLYILKALSAKEQGRKPFVTTLSRLYKSNVAHLLWNSVVTA